MEFTSLYNYFTLKLEIFVSNILKKVWMLSILSKHFGSGNFRRRRRRLHKHTLCLYEFAPTEHMIQENSKILLKNIDWRKKAPSKYFQNVRDILLSLSTLFLRISKKLLSSSKSRIKERISLNSNVFLSYKVRLLTFSNHLLGQCTSFS